MSMVTIQEFNTYSQNYENDTSAVELKQNYLDTAEEIVKDYLGFDPEIKEYDEYFSGIGSSKLFLNARPIQSVQEIIINGNEYDIDDISFKDDCIYQTGGVLIFPQGYENIHVVYEAGYEVIPDIIKVSILRIATLLLMEAGQNIGITSKSNADNSRTFISYTNYDKYLQPLKKMRIVHI